MAKDEGEVNLVHWPGYADKSWADEFTKQTGCKVNTKDGANSDDMVDLIATGAYDGVSASGDATLRLIAKGDAAPVNFDLTSNYADVFEGLKHQSYNSRRRCRLRRAARARRERAGLRRNDALPADTDSWAAIWPGDDFKGKLSIFDGVGLHCRRGPVPEGDAARPGHREPVRARRGPVQRRRRPAEAAAAEHR